MGFNQHAILNLARSRVPCVVLNVVSFVKDEYCVADLHIHGFSDDRVNQIVVRAEDYLGFLCTGHFEIFFARKWVSMAAVPQ